MMYESLKQVDIPEILDGEGDIQLIELKAMRVQVLELVTRIKAQVSAAKGHTVYKHNVIFDMPEKMLITPVLKLTNDMLRIPCHQSHNYDNY